MSGGLDVAAALAQSARWRAWEFAFWAAAALAPIALPQHAALINEIASLALFALSLDLILGYAGIVSLGHAAFFGLGAYAAALFAKHVHPDPLLGLAVAVAVAAALGALCSFTIVRGSDLTRLMVTLGVGLILYELANKFDALTGGADGLQGVVMGPLFGRFEFDLLGHTAVAYSLAVLFLVFLLVRRLVHTPFGWSLQALRDNRLRAQAIGLSVRARLVLVYTLAAAIAGAAGALLAQTTAFASLDLLDFHRSADVLLVLVIGGAGWLYGGLIGAVVFKLMHDLLSAITPQYWTFWIGLFLVVLMLVGRERLLKPWTWRKRNGVA
ncbi:MAG TPA: branched-chain amino acid ABC transporter permease [Methylibium sp.]